MRGRRLLAGFLVVSRLVSVPARAEEAPGDRFVFAVLKHAGTWEPYGDLWPGMRARLERNTSLRPWPERRALSLTDETLEESPFLFLTGRESLRFSDEEIGRLREHLSNGGFLLIDDPSGEGAGPFARAVEALPARLFPGAAWRTVPPEDAVFRSFFLLKGSAGRRRSGVPLKGLWIADRLAALSVSDDLAGAWVPAPAGGWLFPCAPGGEVQREEAQRLLVNIILFSVTGTYKTDAIHQEFIRRKLP